MKIQNTSTDNVIAWTAETGFFPAGAVRVVPTSREERVRADMARGRLSAFIEVPEATPVTHGDVLDTMTNDAGRVGKKKKKAPREPAPPVE